MLFVFLPLGIIRGMWVDEKIAVRTMETQGFSGVQVIDKTWFWVNVRGCSRSDAARFTVKATNPAGKQIETYVCAGWPFKGGTIRTK